MRSIGPAPSRGDQPAPAPRASSANEPRPFPLTCASAPGAIAPTLTFPLASGVAVNASARFGSATKASGSRVPAGASRIGMRAALSDASGLTRPDPLTIRAASPSSESGIVGCTGKSAPR